MPKVNLGKPNYETIFGTAMKAAVVRSNQMSREVGKKIGNCEATMSRRYRNPGQMTLSELKLFIKATGLGKEDVINYLYEGK